MACNKCTLIVSELSKMQYQSELFATYVKSALRGVPLRVGHLFNLSWMGKPTIVQVSAVRSFSLGINNNILIGVKSLLV